MVEPLLCHYCGVAWDADTRRFAHQESCYIRTGVFKTLGRKKRPVPKQETELRTELNHLFPEDL